MKFHISPRPSTKQKKTPTKKDDDEDSADDEEDEEDDEDEKYMFVVSGHLYRPLPLSSLVGSKLRLKTVLGPGPDVFRCRVKHPRVPLAPKPRGVRHMAWFKEP